ncbi:MAG: glycosyltransferase [Cyanomargarita calcarea GSE-NOS-MK-12-04C]|jgi:glycosyltransferase involved in cell wall biosynthesis|uniref:Glycosyltransferase n=1 Tax=Cyanomargarita calcarea GSE-NOS-MK-12-04C TaxID=2839659 RepID=A0A951QPV6_9CYAN|nr:glycosyltransferase [Cyanomargarita calcarea GSE-NOS-MK-12-04C]
MRILTVHNYYQQVGGEDTVFSTESDLLESYGHEVRRYTVHNDKVEQMNAFSLATATLWNGKIYQELREIIRDFRPQVAHFHNTFPLISPAAFYAAKAEGVLVVQTLHNYRLLCPNGLFFRDGKVCEDCLGQPVHWQGVKNACYRDSQIASGAVATMTKLHELLGTWTKVVDILIANSHFALDKFIQGGLPKEKLEFKPNFLHPAPQPGKGEEGYALFVGRLAPEKGTGTLLAAWERLGGKIPLKIVGDGPLAAKVTEAAQQIPGVEWLGRKPLKEVYELMGKAAFLVFPSEWYETFGLVAIEALAKGTPVIAANIGAIAELIDHNRTGLLFSPGDAVDLALKVESLLLNPKKLADMRQQARAEFEAKYTAVENYRRLMEIYAKSAK